METDQPNSRSFRLLDLLAHLGYEDLQALARRFGLVGLSPSRRSLSSQVLAQYRDCEFVSDMVRSLPQSESDLLGFLILLQDLQRQDVLHPPKASFLEGSPQLSATLNTLVELGLVFRSPDDRSRWLIPPEIVPTIRETLVGKEVSEPLQEEEPIWGGTERILWMLFRFLEVIRAGRLHRTHDDALAKRDLDFWLSSLPSDLFPPASVPHMARPENAASFLLAVGRRLGLITDPDGELAIAPDCTGWLSQNRRMLLQDVWSVFLERMATKQADWRPLLFRVVHEKHGGQPLWLVSVSGMSGSRGSLAVWLSWFGLVRVAQSHRGVAAVRTSQPGPWEPLEEKKDEPSHAVSTLQPDFELMIPPDTPLSTLWQIERFADHRRTDVVSIYRLSRQSIIRGLRDNLSSDEIWNYLTELTNGRIPQNVRFSLDEWIDSFGRVRVEKVLLLRCRTPEIAEDILHISETSKAIRERLGPTLLVADPSQISSLLDTLERIGLAPVVHLEEE